MSVKQPIALTDQVDSFGRSFFATAPVTFENITGLTNLRTFELKSAIAQCEYKIGLLAYFERMPDADRRWMLFPHYENLKQFNSQYSKNVAPTDEAEKSHSYGAAIPQERIVELFDHHCEYRQFQKICSAAPYIVVQLENILRNNTNGIFGVSDDLVELEIAKLGRNGSEDKVSVNSMDDASSDDDDCQVGTFGTRVTVFGHQKSLLTLFQEDNIVESVRKAVLTGQIAGDRTSSAGGPNKSKRDDITKCTDVLQVLDNSSILGNATRHDKHKKPFNVLYQPPLREEGKLFPKLSYRHNFRFQLYEYQRRLLYWMIARERQTIFFAAFPPVDLREEKLKDDSIDLDSVCVPAKILLQTSTRYPGGCLLPGLFLKGNVRGDALRSNDSASAQFCNTFFEFVRNSTHQAHALGSIANLFFDTNADLTGQGSEDYLQKLLSCQIQETSVSTDDVVCNSIDRQKSCFGDCDAVAHQRQAFHKFNCAAGTDQCPSTLLAQASLRGVDVQNRAQSLVGVTTSNRFESVLNPALFRCGVSCGRTGCGKTTMKIALIHVMKQWEDEVPDRLRDRSHGEQATTYEALLPTCRRPLTLHSNMMTKRLAKSRRALYYANCTLVICPEQVVEQWFIEFVKTIGCGKARERPKTGKNRSVLNGGVFGEIVDEQDKLLLQVAVVRDIHGLRQVTLADVVERIDVLIVHQNLFKSPSYRSNTKKPLNSEFLRDYRRYGRRISDRLFDKAGDDQWIQGAVAYERKFIQKAETKLQDHMLSATDVAGTRAEYDFESIPKPGFTMGRTLLHAIHFRRAIIDEAHLLSAHVTVVERAVGALNADFWWCLTATANFDVTGAMRRTVLKNEGGYGKLLHIDNDNESRRYLETQHAYRSRFVRECSATTSYEALPRLLMHRVPVTMSAAEMAIYTSLRNGRNNRMRQLMFCSHHMLNNAAWVEKNLSAVACDDNKRGNGEQASVASKLMSVDEVAAQMQSARLAKIKKCNSELIAKLNDFCSDWLNIIEVAPQSLIEVATAEVDDELRFQTSPPGAPVAADCSNSMRVDAEQHEEEAAPQQANGPTDQNAVDNVSLEQLLQAECTREISMLEVHSWKRRRDVRIAMALTRHDEQFSRRGISLRSRYAHAEKELTNLLRQRSKVVKEYSFLQNTLNRLSHPEESIDCPICLSDENTRNSIVLTVCGHEFCSECAKMLFKRNARCAVCRRMLRVPSDLRLVDRSSAHQEEQQAVKDSDNSTTVTHKSAVEQKKSDVREKYGSKLAALIQLIRSVLRRQDCKKIVLFAQFQKLLLLIADVLVENGIEFVVARGSIRSCEKAFRAFRNEKSVRIILLASDKSISGVHLVEANHLIAVHPTLSARGTSEEYSILWQAIGRIRRLMQRSDCHVWQMYTLNTVEEQLYHDQTHFARRKQAMDVGIQWQSSDADSGSVETQSTAQSVAAGENDARESTRRELIRMLNNRLPTDGPSKRKAETFTNPKEDDEFVSDDSTADDWSEELPNSTATTSGNGTTAERFDAWLSSRSYRKRRKL